MAIGAIVGGQGPQSETKVIFKILEYETHLNVNLGGIVRASEGQASVVAIHPSRVTPMTRVREYRLKEGFSIVTGCIPGGQVTITGQ